MRPMASHRALDDRMQTGNSTTVLDLRNQTIAHSDAARVTGPREPTVSLPRRRGGRSLLPVLTPVLWRATFLAAKLAPEDLSTHALMTWTRGLG